MQNKENENVLLRQINFHFYFPRFQVDYYIGPPQKI